METPKKSIQQKLLLHPHQYYGYSRVSIR